MFLTQSNLELCVQLGSTNRANISLKDEGSFFYIFIHKSRSIMFVDIKLYKHSNFVNNGSVCCEYPVSDKARIAFFWSLNNFPILLFVDDTHAKIPWI